MTEEQKPPDSPLSSNAVLIGAITTLSEELAKAHEYIKYVGGLHTDSTIDFHDIRRKTLEKDVEIRRLQGIIRDQADQISVMRYDNKRLLERISEYDNYINKKVVKRDKKGNVIPLPKPKAIKTTVDGETILPDA